jgi:hypothetical protein
MAGGLGEPGGQVGPTGGGRSGACSGLGGGVVQVTCQHRPLLGGPMSAGSWCCCWALDGNHCHRRPCRLPGLHQHRGGCIGGGGVGGGQGGGRAPHQHQPSGAIAGQPGRQVAQRHRQHHPAVCHWPGWPPQCRRGATCWAPSLARGRRQGEGGAGRHQLEVSAA